MIPVGERPFISPDGPGCLRERRPELGWFPRSTIDSNLNGRDPASSSIGDAADGYELLVAILDDMVDGDRVDN